MSVTETCCFFWKLRCWEARRYRQNLQGTHQIMICQARHCRGLLTHKY